jgi:hypothetical protein
MAGADTFTQQQQQQVSHVGIHLLMGLDIV